MGAPADSNVHFGRWSNVGFEVNTVSWGIVAQMAYGIEKGNKGSIGFRISGLLNRNSQAVNSDYFDGYALHYGRQFFSDHFMGRAAIGPGYFYGLIKGIEIHSFGGQFEAEGIWQITDFILFSQTTDIGLGLSGTISAGPKFFVPGISLGLYFGHLK
jgi:hypothetical protein